MKLTIKIPELLSSETTPRKKQFFCQIQKIFVLLFPNTTTLRGCDQSFYFLRNSCRLTHVVITVWFMVRRWIMCDFCELSSKFSFERYIFFERYLYLKLLCELVTQLFSLDPELFFTPSESLCAL